MHLSDMFMRRIMIHKKIKLAGIMLCCLAFTGCHLYSVQDIEGNNYKTVTIGDQVWIAENLKTTKYNDGTPIPKVTDNDAWIKLKTPAYSWYNNDSAANKKPYGALYNWYAVNTGKLCPAGWHVPTDAEWMKLSNTLEGLLLAGGKLKEKGIEHWKSPNEGATNESGFTALPGGYRSLEGIFNYKDVAGYWWSSTKYNESSVLFYNIRYKLDFLYRYRSELYCGFSVRCLKD